MRNTKTGGDNGFGGHATVNPMERAARKLCTIDGSDEGAEVSGKPSWRAYLPAIVAVVNELVEPSQHMREVGAEILRNANPEHSERIGEDDAADVWRMMMRVLLAEQPSVGVIK